jgi:hypothetical protein
MQFTYFSLDYRLIEVANSTGDMNSRVLLPCSVYYLLAVYTSINDL